MAEQLKLALEALALHAKALPGTRRVAANALSTLSAEDVPLSKVTKAVGALEKAPDSVRRAVPELNDAIQAARARLAQLQADTRDVVKRRDQLARAATAKNIGHRFTDAADFIGPFRIEHSEAGVIVRFGKAPVARLKSPTGSGVVTFAIQLEEKLRRAALEGWDNFVLAAEQRQRELSSSEPVPWSLLVESAIPDAKARRRLAVILSYRLALLVSSAAPGGWRFTISYPTLSEQRRAIEVPDLRHPGEPIRVARGRLSRA